MHWMPENVNIRCYRHSARQNLWRKILKFHYRLYKLLKKAWFRLLSLPYIMYIYPLLQLHPVHYIHCIIRNFANGHFSHNTKRRKTNSKRFCPNWFNNPLQDLYWRTIEAEYAVLRTVSTVKREYNKRSFLSGGQVQYRYVPGWTLEPFLHSCACSWRIFPWMLGLL